MQLPNFQHTTLSCSGTVRMGRRSAEVRGVGVADDSDCGSPQEWQGSLWRTLVLEKETVCLPTLGIGSMKITIAHLSFVWLELRGFSFLEDGSCILLFPFTH